MFSRGYTGECVIFVFTDLFERTLYIMPNRRYGESLSLFHSHTLSVSIERKSNTHLNPEADLSVLQPYEEALNLALVIAEWHDVMSQLQEQQDPHLLVSYLFNLATEIGHANRVLRVKDMVSNVAEARWFLFWAAKRVLEQGLELLGLESVEHM